ncbi:MAG: hypothetical protein B6I20_13100 [Bacteroidetes bacterium 4572_117]|nr:MAG: hypothetical protein B6I20_13100 [Bacteroidetes bacterium 4572_117]
MISYISIRNFKSHADTALDLSNLNLFTGMNGMGKSSVMQAFLLLRQTYEKNMLDKGLELRSNLCSLGTAKDALYQSAEDDIISFTLGPGNNKVYRWSFKTNENRPNDTFIKIEPDSIGNISNLNEYSLFNNRFQYISAFRNGPVHDYEKDTSAVEMFNQISQKDGRCELVAHYLDYFKNKPVSHPSLKKNKNDNDKRLLTQVKSWLQEISPEIDIHIHPQETGYKVNYSFSRGAGKTSTNEFKAHNIGFGISYTLPIIVAALHSPKDSIVLIENPEAHIHPEAQAKLMELISKAAKAGVQFIIETHSDHILNGLLVSVKKQIINPNETKVYFFDRETTMHETKVMNLPVLEGGKIKKPPKKFFDRMDKDLDTLMDID